MPRTKPSSKQARDKLKPRHEPVDLHVQLTRFTRFLHSKATQYLTGSLLCFSMRLFVFYGSKFDEPHRVFRRLVYVNQAAMAMTFEFIIICLTNRDVLNQPGIGNG